MEDILTEIRVWSPEEICAATGVPEALKVVMSWVSEYVIKPNASLGRRGVVCPFVPPALSLDVVWLGVCEMSSPTVSEMRVVIDKYLNVYRRLEQLSGEAKEFTTLVVVFPDIPECEAPTLIGDVHRLVKPAIVDEGLMLGEFYSKNASPGLHNSGFYPLRSPLPLFVYRQMVPDDLVFLTKASDPPRLQIRFVEAYLRCFGNRLNDERLGQARAAIAAARSKVAGMCQEGWQT
jgi:hypothetical protein